MPAFPLFHLPYVTLKDTVLKTNEMALLNLALSSDKSRNHVKMFKKPINFIWLNIYEDYCLIDVQFTKKRNIYWKIHKSSKPLKGSKRKIDSFVIDNMEIKNRRHQLRDKYVIESYCDNDRIACIKIAEVMLDIFKPNQLNVYISREETDDICNFIAWDRLNQVDDLTFITYFRLTDKEFHLFKVKILPKKKLTLNFFNYENQNSIQLEFNHDNLEICSAPWFTRQDLLNTNCQNLVIDKTKLTNNDLNAYIKKWLDGADTKLESFKIEIEDPDLDKILDGIQTKNAEDVQRKQDLLNNPPSSFEILFGIRNETSLGPLITRSDNRMATIILDKKCVKFSLWNK